MKTKIIILFFLLTISLFGEWKIIETEQSISLSKLSSDKKAEIVINYLRWRNYPNVMIITEQSIAKDSKIIIEVQNMNGKVIKDEDYYIATDGLLCKKYSDIDFGIFDWTKTLKVYVGKKRIHIFELDNLNKLLREYK